MWETCYYVLLAIAIGAIIRYIVIQLYEAFQFQVGDALGERITKIDPWINGVEYATSYWTDKGRRPYQEDRFKISKGAGEENSSVFAVFDGHAGYRAAQYCQEHLVKRLLDDEDYVRIPSLALKKVFRRINSEFSSLARSRFLSDGTTAVVAAVHGSKIIVANAGDSRCIIVQRGGRSRYMSLDHKPSREDEKRRICNLGGKVTLLGRWRVQGVLAVSRAIGDVSLQPFITSEPDLMEKEITNDDLFLVLASDGIWDVMSNDDVARFVFNLRDFTNVAKDLCNEALYLGTTDNVTAIVVDLRNRRKPAPTNEINGQAAAVSTASSSSPANSNSKKSN